MGCGREPASPVAPVERSLGEQDKVEAMFGNALKMRRLFLYPSEGESLETARRLYGVGNYPYARDLVGYLIAQSP